MNKSFKDEKKDLKRIKEVKKAKNNRISQQLKLKNSKKNKKSVGRNKPNNGKIHKNPNIQDYLGFSHEGNHTHNGSKSSFHNPKAWKEFLEVRKEINEMNEKLFMSTDCVLTNKDQQLNNSITYTGLRKSESVNRTNSPSLLNEVLNGNEKRVRIKSIKELKSTSQPRIKEKSKGPMTKRKGKGHKI